MFQSIKESGREVRSREVAVNLLYRGCQTLGAFGSLILIIRYLSPVEQGYWFLLESVVAMRNVLDLGFSTVLVSVTSRECARLGFTSQRSIAIPPSVGTFLHVGLGWYIKIAAAFSLLALGLLGSTIVMAGEVGAGPAWPFLATTFLVAVSLAISPLLYFLEGCGAVAEVGAVRVAELIASIGTMWATLALDFGLSAYPIGLSIGVVTHLLVVFLAFGGIVIPGWRSGRTHDASNVIDEIRPVRFRMAISYLSGFLSAQALTPITLILLGPVSAGRLGASFLVANGIASVAATVTRARLSHFSTLGAQGKLAELQRRFQRSLRTAIGIGFIGALAAFSATVVGSIVDAQALTRFAPLPALTLVLATSVLAAATQAFSLYLRAFQEEPLLRTSVIVALASITTVVFLGLLFGEVGVAAAFLLSYGFLNLILTFSVFRRYTPSAFRANNLSLNPTNI